MWFDKKRRSASVEIAVFVNGVAPSPHKRGARPGLDEDEEEDLSLALCERAPSGWAEPDEE